MAYNARLANRVRNALNGIGGIEEKPMFGGLTFMLQGNMCCGVAKDDLVLRVGPEGAETAVQKPHVRLCDFTGKPMKGMVMVSPAGCGDDGALREWVAMAVEFAGSLPAK